MRSLILGEVIIDCVQPDKSTPLFSPVNGGSPYNMALALARLQGEVDLATSISDDMFGAQVLASMEIERIGATLVQRVAQPSTLAMVHSTPDGTVSYSFYLSDTSIGAFRWQNVAITERHDHIHPGSYVALEQSMAADCLTFLRQHADSRCITFDPNIRLDLTPDAARLRPLVESYASLSACIKASDEDIGILYPGMDMGEAARHLLQLGPELVIITLGAQGSLAVHKEHQLIEVTAMALEKTGDSVGAGDSFMATCFWYLRQQSWISRPALAAMSRQDIATMLNKASQVAGYNCQSFGCQPPRLVDLGWNK